MTVLARIDLPVHAGMRIRRLDFGWLLKQAERQVFVSKEGVNERCQRRALGEDHERSEQYQ
jgi:hypothetical protein